MKNNTEIELKLVLSEEALEKMFSLELLQGALRKDSRKVHNLCSSYYDSKDMLLNAQGIAYRVRDKGDGTFEATVKTSKKRQGGLSERVEINIPLAEDKAILTGFKAKGLGCELTDIVPQGVVKLFASKVERITYLLDYEGAVIEMAIDKGYLVAASDPSRRDAIDEVELELMEGPKESLLKFAKLIGEQVTLREESRSKYARGLALCHF